MRGAPVAGAGVVLAIVAALVGSEGACGSGGQAATNGSDAATGADVSEPVDAGAETAASEDGTTDAPHADAPAATDAPVTHDDAATDAATDAGGAPLPALPLQVSGRWIVDAKGKRFKLAAVNWYGAEEQDFVVAGLDKLPLATIAHEIRALGFNAVRLPWSNQMFESDPPIGAALLSANPALKGKTALGVLDAVIDALAFEGIVVILDDHTSDANWCCSNTDGDGLWYTATYPETSWIADWRAIVARYASQPAVVGADLRNEPRSVCSGSTCQVATWGGSDPSVDWHAAAQRGGEAVLGANSKLLVFVEGVNYANDLTGVYSLPVALSVPNRLVYEAHDYAWDHNGLQSAADLHTTLGDWWGYILAQGKSYTAPVWVGEFGTCHTSPTCVSDSTGQGLWFSAIGQYLTGADIDWSYWALDGTEARGTGRTYGAEETYGVLDVAWSAPALSNLTAALQALQPATQGP